MEVFERIRRLLRVLVTYQLECVKRRDMILLIYEIFDNSSIFCHTISEGVKFVT